MSAIASPNAESSDTQPGFAVSLAHARINPIRYSHPRYKGEDSGPVIPKAD